MKKYKVEILISETYIVDVLAKNETEAKELALEKWDSISEQGIAHYHQEDDTRVETGTIYDVTNTDDPFNP